MQTLKQLAVAVITAGHTATATPNKTHARQAAEAQCQKAYAALLAECARKFGKANAERIASQEVAFA